MLFCTFLSRRCTTTTWKCLISRFVEDGNTRQRVSFSFPELWYSLLEFSSRKSCQHLRNWTRWTKRETVWSRATVLFQWRFRGRRRRCCLSSLISVGRRRALKNLWLLFAEKATMWLCIWLGTSLVWVGEVKSNMDWSGCIARLYMETLDFTFLGSSQFSYRLQVRKLFRRLL